MVSYFAHEQDKEWYSKGKNVVFISIYQQISLVASLAPVDLHAPAPMMLDLVMWLTFASEMWLKVMYKSLLGVGFKGQGILCYSDELYSGELCQLMSMGEGGTNENSHPTCDGN